MEYIELKPEVDAALKRMKENMPPAEIFKEVAASILQTVPDASEKNAWKHGSCRVIAWIGKYDDFSVEMDAVPDDADLSDINYAVFYRQAVRNKHTGEKKAFASWFPCGMTAEVKPGQTVILGDGIHPGWKRDELEAMARESFLKLQEMVTEFYNREAA